MVDPIELKMTGDLTRAKAMREPRQVENVAARLGDPHVRLAEPGENLALGEMPVAHHPLAPVGELLVTERRQVLLELRPDRSLDQPPLPRSQKLREGVGSQCWRHQRDHSIVAHVRCAPLAETVSRNSISAKTRRTSQLVRTPLSTIARPVHDRIEVTEVDREGVIAEGACVEPDVETRECAQVGTAGVGREGVAH